jgi:hypothetical protein
VERRTHRVKLDALRYLRNPEVTGSKTDQFFLLVLLKSPSSALFFLLWKILCAFSPIVLNWLEVVLIATEQFNGKKWRNNPD